MGDSGADRPVSRQVRAAFDDRVLTVYQAYSPVIAGPAVARGTFVPPFKRERMTWIKPSFLWMMYRCGWATKPGQEHVLAISILRTGFDWALGHAALSAYDPHVHPSHQDWLDQKASAPVRIQWDPERSLALAPLGHRAIQVGLGGQAVTRYVDEWIVAITDITARSRQIHDLVAAGDTDAARDLLPAERPYPVPATARASIGAT